MSKTQRRASLDIGSDYWMSPLCRYPDSVGYHALDHLFWFYAKRRPAAIAVMPYDDGRADLRAAAQQVGERYQLDVAWPPREKAGWWYPGWTALYVFVPRRTAVNWLPEQMEQSARLPRFQ